MASIFEEIFGQQPEAAKYSKQNLAGLGGAQGQSILGNIGSFEDISKLGDLYKQWMDKQYSDTLGPDYLSNFKSATTGIGTTLKNANDFASGIIPKDVQDKVFRDSAQQAFQGGFAGSGMHAGLTARDFGLTSLDLMGRGAQMIGQAGNSMQQWSSLAGNDILNPTSMFTTPNQVEQANMQNEVYQTQSQQNALNAKNAPNPVAAGVFNTIMGLTGSAAGSATSLGSAYLQGGGGGGGGGGL